MSEIVLQAKIRAIGKENNRESRNQGFIPAVLYGPKTENLHLLVSEKDFDSFFNSGHKTRPFALKLDNGKSMDNVLLHEYQKDSLKNEILSIDFYQFDASKKIRVNVPIVLQGKAPAQDLGGVVVLNMNEVEIECLPVNIPDSVFIEIGVLADFDATIYIKDLKLPQGVVCHLDPQTSVVSVSEPLKEEVVAPVQEAVPVVESAPADEKTAKTT